jgi:glycosidase
VEVGRRAAILRDLGYEIIMRRPASNLFWCCRAIIAGAVFTPLAAQAPAWTRGATCYEIFVRSFQDSNGDGIGDLRGLISRLDYINDGNPHTHTDLGARCIWLMPVAQSPSYHGYDATDYYTVESDYGTNDDFKRLVSEAHRRGIKILVDMVLNHTSNEHPWFVASAKDTASPFRTWYRWSPTQPAQRHPWGGDATLWHRSPVRGDYYYGIFWSGMPDLNYENPAVREEAKKIARFWLQDMGVDGFRLDAIPYLVEVGDSVAGTSGTHNFLHEYQAYLKTLKPDVYTVGEVWDSVGAMLPYYPEQLDSHFAFEVADKIIASVRSGSARGMLAPSLRLQHAIPQWRWAPFLRNHDGTRTRTEFNGDMARARIASFLLLTMPGLPFVYYGEEIGMIGNKPDERLRTPMQWTAERGGGFTTGKPWEAFQDDSARTTVAAEDKDPRSILNLHRRLIPLRDQNAALATGELVPLTASSDAVAAYLRRDGNDVVLVIANLGDSTLTGVRLSSTDAVLPPGQWRARSLLGADRAATLTVRGDGRVEGYVPLTRLASREGYLFELTPGR